MVIFLFGAGKVGRKAFISYSKENSDIVFIDNNKAGGNYLGRSVISLDDYISKSKEIESQLVISVNARNAESIVEQLKSKDVSQYVIFDEAAYDSSKVRLISYSHPHDMEDVILFHALRDENDIFYIDCGANDPFNSSVTKLLYDMKEAHGINIEPQSLYANLCRQERPRDITIQTGLGSKEGELELFIQGGNSTFVEKNIIHEKCNDKIMVPVCTLKSICDKYLKQDQHISFLKIDVEGFEKEVLEGADFVRYRPKLLVIESTKPNSMAPNYEAWEPIVIQAGYRYVYEYGVNRYYLANEYDCMPDMFLAPDGYGYRYNIYHAHESRI